MNPLSPDSGEPTRIGAAKRLVVAGVGPRRNRAGRAGDCRIYSSFIMLYILPSPALRRSCHEE
jgi:hypothetical protein